MWHLKATKPFATTKEFSLKSYRHYCRYIFFLFFGQSQNLLLELQSYEFFLI